MFLIEWDSNPFVNFDLHTEDRKWISNELGKNVRPQFLQGSKAFLLKSSKAWNKETILFKVPLDYCGQFHQHFMWEFFVRKCFGQLHVTKEKLPKRLLYKKSAHKMLMKLTPGLNFINILCTAFTLADPESVKRYLWLNCIFLRFKDLWA